MRTLPFISALLISAASVAAPLVIGHSGRLLGDGDEPIEGVQKLTFTLYKDFETPRGGSDTRYWTETRDVVVTRGIYALQLGDVAEPGGKELTTDALGDGTEARWLGITIGTSTELKPRLQLGAAPYAIRAAFANDAAKITCTGCISAAQLATGAVGADELVDGAIGGLEIANGAIAAAHLAPNAVTTGALANGAVTAAKIPAGTIAADHLAAGSVTLEKIADRDPTTGLVVGLNASQLEGRSAAQVAALADPTAKINEAIVAALGQLTGVQRSCNDGNGLQVFNGSAWGTCTPTQWNCAISPSHAGCVSGSTYSNCAAIRADSKFIPTDGTYWVDLDGGGPKRPLLVYCDMLTDGGGWTLAMQTSSTVAADGTFGYSANYWTTANVTNDSNVGLVNVNAKYDTFNSLVSEAGRILLRDKESGRYTTLAVPSLQGNTLVNRFTNMGRTALTVTSGQATPQELMGYPAPTTICAQNSGRWMWNLVASHSAVRLGNDVGTNDQVTNSAGSWPCYNGEGINLAYSGMGGTLESGRQFQDSYGSETLNRWRDNNGTGQGSHNGVALFVR